jgi:hypothetical protein
VPQSLPARILAALAEQSVIIPATARSVGGGLAASGPIGNRQGLAAVAKLF